MGDGSLKCRSAATTERHRRESVGTAMSTELKNVHHIDGWLDNQGDTQAKS